MIASDDPNLKDEIFWSQLVQWFSPWREVRKYPGPLLKWVVISVGLGSAGVWLTPAASLDSWLSSLTAGSLGTFCIVLLSQSIATSMGFVDQELGGLRDAENGRQIAFGLAIIFILVQAAVIFRFKAVDLPSASLVVIQLLLVFLTVSTAIYVLCFKLHALEPGAEMVSMQENKEVRDLSEEANRIKASKSGDAL